MEVSALLHTTQPCKRPCQVISSYMLFFLNADLIVLVTLQLHGEEGGEINSFE